MVKYYVDQKVKTGFCGYRYPSQGLRCTFRYDPEKLPYLGLWITAGGFRGDYNCALEPANGYYDSIPKAAESGSLCFLKKEEPFHFPWSSLSRKSKFSLPILRFPVLY